MIVKQGTLQQPAVVNYFNARINVENFLRKSRFGMTISFTIGPKGLLLRAGETIKIAHDKFGWTGKIFRITNLSYNKNCNASITAEEYDVVLLLCLCQEKDLFSPINPNTNHFLRYLSPHITTTSGCQKKK